MKRPSWKLNGLMAAILLLGSGIVADETSNDSAHETTSGISYEPQILSYGLKNLNYLKEALPDLHEEVTSPDWIEMGGSDKLRLVVGSMTNVWGAKDEDIDAYLSRFDQYESTVPVGEKGEVEMVFGLMGEHLLRQFFDIERGKELTQALVEAYSVVWEDDDPGKLVEYERCLDRTIVAMSANTIRTFAEWLDGAEKITANADMFMPHVSLQSKTATELVDSVTTESLRSQQKCNPDGVADF